jgi:2-polyprenyl-3-methyl-5-hydroxy-6-metoxy-1,4-benzoquinol methylase
MSRMTTLQALIVLHRAFRSRQTSTRLHVLIRFLTCPFLRITREIPSGAAALLEIGAGHGVLAILTAAQGARVVAVEPDLRKLFPPSRGGARFVGGYADAVSGQFAVVAMIDVLYKVPQQEWPPLLRSIRERTSPGGVFLLKEQDPTVIWKNRWNRIQESLNSRFLEITLGEAFSYEPPEAMVRRLIDAGFADVRVERIDRGYPHPHILYVARRADEVWRES